MKYTEQHIKFMMERYKFLQRRADVAQYKESPGYVTKEGKEIPTGTTVYRGPDMGYCGNSKELRDRAIGEAAQQLLQLEQMLYYYFQLHNPQNVGYERRMGFFPWLKSELAKVK